MNDNRLIAGLWCTDVLGHLGDYLDGDLPAGTRASVEQHLAECRNCARFGADVGGLLQAILQAPEPLPAEVGDRLRAVLSESK